MENTIRRIDNWLRVNAPEILNSLQEPAEDAKIQELKNIVGLGLPSGLIDWFETHNGIADEKFANLVFGLTFYSIEKTIIRHNNITSAMYDEDMKHYDNGIKSTFNASEKKVAFADDNGSCQLYFDLDPDISGKFGQVVFFDSTYQVALLIENSIEELFKSFERDLGDGKYKLLPEALEDGVHWLQPEGDLDIINWFKQNKWSSILKKT